VTQVVDEEFDENYDILTFKQSSLRVMIWACIMKGSKGPMVVLEYPGGRGRGMTADRYQDQVLDKVLFDYYVQMSEERGQVISSRTEPLAIVPNPLLHGSRETRSKYFRTHHLPPILAPLNLYGTGSKQLLGHGHTLLQDLMSSKQPFRMHGIKLQRRILRHMSST